MELPESTIGLDIDGVLADFTGALYREAERMGLRHHFPELEKPHPWDFGTPHFNTVWNEVAHHDWFWLSIPPIPGAVEAVTFKPRAYITARTISNRTTIKWLRKHGFPVPERCYSVGRADMKIDLAHKLGITHFVDDKPETVEALNKVGIKTYMFHAPCNWHTETEHDRLYCLSHLNHEGQVVRPEDFIEPGSAPYKK
jgi:FMN phosphatase YigB (HAD superfamily)